MRNDIRPPRIPTRPAAAVPVVRRKPAPRPVPDRPPVTFEPSTMRLDASEVAAQAPVRDESALSIGTTVKRTFLVGAAVLALVVVGIRAQAAGSTLQTEVTGDVRAARQALDGARESLATADYAGARAQFSVAESALHRANLSLAQRGQIGGLLSTQGAGSISAGKEMAASGELLAASGAKVSEELAGIQSDLAARGNDFYKLGEVLAQRLPSLRQHLGELDQRIDLLSYTVAGAKRTAPGGEMGAAVAELDGALPKLTAGIKQARQTTDQLPALLGMDRFKQYLIVFQNPAELRATGGFIGTYGRIKFDKGVLGELLVDSIYNPANQANMGSKEAAPAPYGRFYGDTKEPVWGMQDANWSPDFPTSAKKFQYFYEKSGGPTTDGVIGLTVTPIIELLRLVGPIEMPEYDYTLTAENFQGLIQADQQSRSVASDTDPKKVLRDFTPKLLAKIGQAPPRQQQDAYKIIGRAAATRDLQVHFGNADLQAMATDLGIAGSMRPEFASLSVVDTNIAGRKSSVDIATTIRPVFVIGKNGTVTVDLAVTRRHTAASSPDTNLNYTRVYLPKGSNVSQRDGFAEYAEPTVTDEDGFTIVGGWTDVAPGTERTVHITYTLPEEFDLSDASFPFFLQKQAGTAATVEAEFQLPDGYVWNDTGSATASLSAPAATDLRRAFGFRKGG